MDFPELAKPVHAPLVVYPHGGPHVRRANSPIHALSNARTCCGKILSSFFSQKLKFDWYLQWMDTAAAVRFCRTIQRCGSALSREVGREIVVVAAVFFLPKI